MEKHKFKLPPESRALVTGATGFTGSVLVRKLVSQGVEVVAIARTTSNITAFDDLPITWIQGDVFDEELIERAIKGVNYVFHMVTPFREAKLLDIGYHQVHVLSTQLLAKAALKEPNFQRFIHVSTIGVHGHIETPPANENYRMKPGDIYQETKQEAELWIRDFSDKEGLPLSVVRPAGIYGPGDKRLLKIFKMVARKWILLIGDGSNLYHFIHVDDLTDFMFLVATHPKAKGEVFICGSPSAMTFKKMVSIIAQYYGVNVRYVRLPAPPLFVLGYFFELICRPLRIEPPIYRRRVAFFTKDRSFNTEKMRKILDFYPAYSDQEGIKKTAQWYLEQGWLSI